MCQNLTNGVCRRCPFCNAHMDLLVPTADIPIGEQGRVAQSEAEVTDWVIGCDHHMPRWLKEEVLRWEDERRREIAREEGMLNGIDSYNDWMGY